GGWAGLAVAVLVAAPPVPLARLLVTASGYAGAIFLQMLSLVLALEALRGGRSARWLAYTFALVSGLTAWVWQPYLAVFPVLLVAVLVADIRRVVDGGEWARDPLSLWERVRVRAARGPASRGSPGSPHPNPLPEGEGIARPLASVDHSTNVRNQHRNQQHREHCEVRLPHPGGQTGDDGEGICQPATGPAA